MEWDLDRQALGRSELPINGKLVLVFGEGKPAAVTLAGRLVVQNLASRVVLNGTLRAAGRAECSRCLADFALEWDVPVAMQVLRKIDTDEEEGETLLIVQSSGVVDLADPLREAVVLSFPQSPVCRDSCLGLCPTCGGDRNEVKCDCTEEDYDPRWEGLPE